ncbi:hypothetical protein [Parasulfitobacter algicola]|uniref:Uncharacterized protein n=1 Tax=Parasulfitobacter algicola TaxID=2614809 RepID=A0ABX2IKV3_9RHOB|nr:hypothetical protein [Sulfitobacter algicola]NSX53479.1 hypothetical protein [Sulfitobacter algicola]
MIIVARTPAVALIMSVYPKQKEQHASNTCYLHNAANTVYASSAFKQNRNVRSASVRHGQNSCSGSSFGENEVVK